MTLPFDPRPLVGDLFRRHAGMISATLVRILGTSELDLVEEVVQDALVRALETWPYSGVPARPCAWLVQAAKNRAIDLIRQRALRVDRLAQLEAWVASEYEIDDEAGQLHIRDDLLRMLFVCCHPDLPTPSRIALSLKVVAGFSVREISRGLLVEEAAVAQRLARARRFMREEGVPFELPGPEEMSARLGAVLEVIYLWFREGYSPQEGPDAVRADVCSESLHLATLVASHERTAEPRSHALVALLCFLSARIAARTDAEGQLLLLRDQDRRQWDRRLIVLGLRHLEASARGEELTRYHIEAGIASCHATASDYGSTDWERIHHLYGQLAELAPSPIVEINRAIALSRYRGAEAGIAAIERVSSSAAVDQYDALPGALAELWSEAGRPDRAIPLYERALARNCSAPVRRFLERRMLEARIRGSQRRASAGPVSRD